MRPYVFIRHSSLVIRHSVLGKNDDYLGPALLLSFDWLWFLTLVALSGAGIVAIWSTTDGTNLNSYFGKQLVYLCCSCCFFNVGLF